MSHTAAMSCASTMNDATSMSRQLPSLVLMTLSHVTVAPSFMPDYPTRMSIFTAMWLSPSLSHPTCYLQDRDEIADDVIITKPRNRYVKVTVISLHPLTVQSDINPRATVASIKVLFRGIKASIQPHFALSDTLYRLCIQQFTGFPA